MAAPAGPPQEIGWRRATGTALALAAGAFVLLAVVPHLIVTRPWVAARGTRELAAVAWFVVAFIGVLLLLRRLQARGWT